MMLELTQKYIVFPQVVTNTPQRVITDSGQHNEFHLSNGLSDGPPKALLNSSKCSLMPALSVFVPECLGVALN
jgi:hypothetical protein